MNNGLYNRPALKNTLRWTAIGTGLALVIGCIITFLILRKQPAKAFEIESTIGSSGINRGKAIQLNSGGKRSSAIKYNRMSSGDFQLTSFSGTRLKEGISLKWTTGAEKGNDFFTLERSTDGKYFAELTNVKSKGNTYSGHSYSVIDQTASSGNIYYRLSHADNNSTNNFNVIVIRNNMMKEITLHAIIPNPFSESFIASISSPESTLLTLSLYSQDGQLAEKKDYNITTGDNFLSFIPSRNMTGIYIVIFTANEKIIAAEKITRL